MGDFSQLRPRKFVSKAAASPGYPEISRKMWEAERAKLGRPKANAAGWIRHRGGKCPVEKGVLVDVRYRSGEINCGVSALTYSADGEHVEGTIGKHLARKWKHDGSGLDIMAWRLHKPEEATIPGKTEPEVFEIAEPAQTRNDPGPLEWRDRIREIDRTAKELQDERAALVKRLADEGLCLIE